MPSSTLDPVKTLTSFARALRSHGVAAGSGQVITLCRAAQALDAATLDDLYWAGRLCLVNHQWELETYDEVFRRFFGSEVDKIDDVALLVEEEVAAATAGGSRPGDQFGPAAWGADSLRHKDFAGCTPQEMDELRRLMARTPFVTDSVFTRRRRSARRGAQDDLRRTLREAMRTDGELMNRRYRRRRTRLRPLVLLLDVSGSMADYSSALLRFAYAARQGPAPVEVFCFGTNIARVTDRLSLRDPDVALAEAAAAVFDWEGGTRIGESLHAFNRTWGGRTGYRGAEVVICCDGLEWGSPQRLADEVARLRRRSRRIIWVNPRAANPLIERYPNPFISAIQPHVDEFVTGHNLESLEELAKLLRTSV